MNSNRFALLEEDSEDEYEQYNPYGSDDGISDCDTDIVHMTSMDVSMRMGMGMGMGMGMEPSSVEMNMDMDMDKIDDMNGWQFTSETVSYGLPIHETPDEVTDRSIENILKVINKESIINVPKRIYMLFSTPEEVSCESHMGTYDDINCLIETICKYSHSGNWEEIYKFGKSFVDPLIKYPCDLSEFGEDGPKYDGVTTMHPLQNVYGLSCDYINYSVYVIDIPNKNKYKLVELTQCLCFEQAFTIKKIEDMD